MGKIRLIIQREYISRVRQRSFLITTLLAPAGFALFFLAVIFLTGYSSESKRRIVVKDDSGFFRNKFADSPSLYFFFSDSALGWLERHYRSLNYDGILWIPPLEDLNHPRGIQFRSDMQLGIKTKEYIESQIENVLREKKIEQANIDREVLRSLENISVSLTGIVYGEEGEKTGDTLIATALGYLMGFVIYIVLFIYGAMVMKGVMEEKASRIIEVMAASVRPFQMMMGKVVGIGAVGLTQFILWFILIGLVYFIFGIAFAGKLAAMQQFALHPELAPTTDQYEIALALSSREDIPVFKLLFFFLYYFLGGYLIYGSLYAALGSAANDEGDTQSLTVFISVPIVISILIMMSAIQEPNSPLALWASIIPFTAPIVMPARIPFEPAAWQIAASMISVAAGFVFTTWAAAKIYRTGILLYGKKITLKELWKWAVQSKAF
ncbi:MAG TPA: ABC transporter permease [Chitinophagales bacterium]|nr:ABC transporter permease [Chitinophagales bacterium]